MAKRIQAPICAICGRQVDRFQQLTDPCTQTEHFVAYCHGQEQKVRLTLEQIVAAGPHGISMAKAFDAPRIEGAAHE